MVVWKLHTIRLEINSSNDLIEMFCPYTTKYYEREITYIRQSMRRTEKASPYFK